MSLHFSFVTLFATLATCRRGQGPGSACSRTWKIFPSPLLPLQQVVRGLIETNGGVTSRDSRSIIYHWCRHRASVLPRLRGQLHGSRESRSSGPRSPRGTLTVPHATGTLKKNKEKFCFYFISYRNENEAGSELIGAFCCFYFNFNHNFLQSFKLEGNTV